MCKWGDDAILDVFIPASLSCTGKGRWDKKGIDRCIAPIVQALNDGGIVTAQSCCGHGKAPGRIDLLDGRVLIVTFRPAEGCGCEIWTVLGLLLGYPLGVLAGTFIGHWFW